jgi:L-ascorbate metabolism protein UlaG (beta-lactamase superfamily)
MHIFWHGYSSVGIESKNGETGCLLVTDPFLNEAAIRFPRTLEPDALVLSHQDRSRFNVEGVGGSPFIISDPGEYEVRGVFIQGIQDGTADEGEKRPLVYRIVSEGMNLAVLGSLGRMPTNEEIERLGSVDILLVPVGGGGVLEAKQASELIATFEPRMVVPLSYAVPGLKQQLGSVDAFVKAVGGCERENMPKLKLSKKDLPAEQCTIAVLERS